MKPFIYRGKEVRNIGLFGPGKSTIALLTHLKSNYSDLNFTLRSDSLISNDSELHSYGFDKIFTGKEAVSQINEDVIFFSPSVRRERIRELAPATVLSSEIEYFFEHCSSDVFSVTGSDGKSTTVTLCADILMSAYGSSVAVGNIGVPAVTSLSAPTNTPIACELSSFQLNYFAPSSKRALVTNISENHLDWHRTFNEYVEAKRNIYYNAKECVFNFNSPITLDIATVKGAFAVYSSTANFSELRSNIKAENYVYQERGTIMLNGGPLCPIDLIPLKSSHNIENLMAAIALCADVSTAQIIDTVAKNFKGLPHRCESIGVFDGVKYIDSSIDTSPKRTATTLSTISGPLIVIIGGRSKTPDYSSIVPILKQRAKAIVLTGENGKQLFDMLSKEGFCLPTVFTEDFKEAIECARYLSHPGDTVILSPASTSFDRFKSFEERGELFKKTVFDICGYANG